MNKLIYILIIPLIFSCSLVKLETRYFKEDGKPVQKKEMDFDYKQALAKGGTINNQTANKIYHEGTEPKSPEAQRILDFSYEVMGIFGVNTDFDIDDPESLEKAKIATREAVEEKNRIIAKLEEDVKAKEHEKKKIVEDKVA